MATRTAPSAKANLLRGIYGRVYTAFNRALGEMGRVRTNPAGAEREAAKAEEGMLAMMIEQLGRTGLPVVVADAPAPAGEHWVVSGLESHRNVLYARMPVTLAAAHVDASGVCSIGAIFVPHEDLCALAETGLGVSGDGVGRMRVGGRTELADALAMVPWKTVDAIGVMQKLDAAQVHTRKSGNPYADIVEVALGRADMSVGTRVTRLEALLAALFMTESGGFASDMAGKPLTAASTGLVLANPKLQPKVVAALS